MHFILDLQLFKSYRALAPSGSNAAQAVGPCFVLPLRICPRNFQNQARVKSLQWGLKAKSSPAYLIGTARTNWHSRVLIDFAAVWLDASELERNFKQGDNKACGCCDDTRNALFVKDPFTFADGLFERVPGVNGAQASFTCEACAEALFGIVEDFFR